MRHEPLTHDDHHADDGAGTYSAETAGDGHPWYGKSRQVGLMDGDQMERDLVSVLRALGFASMRSPGSGTGDWPMPDIIAGHQGVVVCIELKTGNPPTNVTTEEVQGLRQFAREYGACVLLAGRWYRDRTFYLAPPGPLSRNDSGDWTMPADPADWAWSVRIPYTDSQTKDQHGYDLTVEPREDDDARHGYEIRADEQPPRLVDYLDALATDQHGFDVRQGIIDSDMGADDD